MSRVRPVHSLIRQLAALLLLCMLPACGNDKTPEEAPAAERRSPLAINTEAAERGNPDAQYALAMMYENGRGVEQSSRTAMEWLEKAARQNHSEAQYLLARMYSHSMDLVKAIAWLELAARAGDRTASQELRELHGKMPEAMVQQARELADQWAAEMEE